MKLYHATYKQCLESIKKHGINNKKANYLWEDSNLGTTYLAVSKEIAESYAETNDEVPEEYLDNIVVLEIDSQKLDLKLLSIDNNVLDNEGDTLEYKGVIPFKFIKNKNIFKTKRKNKP